MKTASSQPIELQIDTSSVTENIPYTHYEKGKDGSCWFCGCNTNHYRAFEYKKFQTKPAGWAEVKNIEKTIVLKIWTCPGCEKRIDSIKDIYERKQSRLFIFLFLIGLVVTVVLLRMFDSTWGLSIFLGLFGGTALALLSMPLAKLMTQKETNGIKNEIRDRLNQHPEVVAVHNEGFDRFYD